ncbi:unnamed protein product [Amoebophrya sp. A120]|nr:unnamed protein product [Amoebophrya sp. A120]|eukprot:GSA120T00010662001.1
MRYVTRRHAFTHPFIFGSRTTDFPATQNRRAPTTPKELHFSRARYYCICNA